jgi:uncharacterized membrane protein YwzB
LSTQIQYSNENQTATQFDHSEINIITICITFSYWTIKSVSYLLFHKNIPVQEKKVLLYSCRMSPSIPVQAYLESLKVQSHEIFDLWFFSSMCTPGSPDSWAKTVLHIDSNSGVSRFDEENRFRAMLHSAESQLVQLENLVRLFL